MSDTEQVTESIAATLAKASKLLEAVLRALESAFGPNDPNDPLNEVLPDTVTDGNSSFSLDRSVNDYLKRVSKPRTIRNLLQAYAHCLNSGYSFCLESQEGDGVYRIYRIMECRTESPSSDPCSPIRSTSAFPLPLDVPPPELIGWTFRFLNREFKVLDACEIDGHSYLITES